MAAVLILWSHALAALLFAALALWSVRARTIGAPRGAMVAALAGTALWALAVAGIGSVETATTLAGILRNLGWLLLVHRLLPVAERRRASLLAATGIIACVFVGGGLLGAAGAADPSAAQGMSAFAASGIALRLLAVLGALVLVLHAYRQAPPGIVRGLALAAAAIWVIDANLLTLAWATGEWPPVLLAARGAAFLALATILAALLQRGGEHRVEWSRAVAFQSLSLLAVLAYFAALALATAAVGHLAGEQARVFQTAFIFGSTAALLTILSTAPLRAWARVKLAKHLFRHRYDYRAEWMRFTDTLGSAEGAAPLDERVVKAVADLTLSPAGVLLLPEAEGLVVGTHWNWPPGDLPAAVTAGALARHLGATNRVIELDAVRAGNTEAGDIDAVPAWMLSLDAAWVIVPLPHLGALAGAILLARPPIERALDWEDFDLLKVAGRQVASYLAEARAQTRLAEAERFEEFNRRFAFILHDIKNLVSQLSLVARNAERHADNPAFRADMVATLNESAGRMTELVARLSQARPARAEPPRAVAVRGIVDALAAERRLVHPVIVRAGSEAVALADPARLEQILRHLIQNAIDASPAGEPVLVQVDACDAGVAIEVIDKGCGMSPGFMRDQLFRPFVSTKATGFGIGAFEARQHALAMGGTLDVTSREGEGTRFRLVLPAACRAEDDMGKAA
ncbi:XrtA/PEP-CTERM system histidine kinase PrsK [Sphingomonas baiyangensis]|uniref:histidine kinase n=1 Tax=Sphingomonas baiyangensis TaxID=2572576 RepID=A0A4U1L426_9SPHN|nr:XrtA/PEP-CTERM system histidine kinase PrsK [Sphingomonas baiyangensis]TKD51254.1 PEP-CTERM system histidine kinase PrsK [Sphingomonas baiyangensis]